MCDKLTCPYCGLEQDPVRCAKLFGGRTPMRGEARSRTWCPRCDRVIDICRQIKEVYHVLRPEEAFIKG